MFENLFCHGNQICPPKEKHFIEAQNCLEISINICEEHQLYFNSPSQLKAKAERYKEEKVNWMNKNIKFYRPADIVDAGTFYKRCDDFEKALPCYLVTCFMEIMGIYISKKGYHTHYCLNNIGECYSEIGKKMDENYLSTDNERTQSQHYKTALKFFEASREIMPNDFWTFYHNGLNYYRMKDFSDAYSQFITSYNLLQAELMKNPEDENLKKQKKHVWKALKQVNKLNYFNIVEYVPKK